MAVFEKTCLLAKRSRFLSRLTTFLRRLQACGPHYAEKAIYEFTQRLSQLPHLLKESPLPQES